MEHYLLIGMSAIEGLWDCRIIECIVLVRIQRLVFPDSGSRIAMQPLNQILTWPRIVDHLQQSFVAAQTNNAMYAESKYVRVKKHSLRSLIQVRFSWMWLIRSWAVGTFGIGSVSIDVRSQHLLYRCLVNFLPSDFHWPWYQSKPTHPLSSRHAALHSLPVKLWGTPFTPRTWRTYGQHPKFSATQNYTIVQSV